MMIANKTRMIPVIYSFLMAISFINPLVANEETQTYPNSIDTSKAENPIADDVKESIEFKSDPKNGTIEQQPSQWEYWWQSCWGEPANNHIYLGMWTYHFMPGDDQDWNNQLIAVAYDGYYAGSFINTHSDRTWSAGVQRKWYEKQWGGLDIELGYRAGVMYGYKKYLTIGDSKLFPLFQVVTDITYKDIGIELSWAGVVATVGFSIKF